MIRQFQLKYFEKIRREWFKNANSGDINMEFNPVAAQTVSMASAPASGHESA